MMHPNACPHCGRYGRKGVRRFDHDAALARVRNGEPLDRVAKDVGVTTAAMHKAFKKAHGTGVREWTRAQLAKQGE